MGKNVGGKVKLTSRQLFTLKTKERISDRFKAHYKEYTDAAYIIQSAVIVLVRNFFSEQDFSDVAKDLIRSLFLTNKGDLSSVRHLCVYFQPYFNSQEWELIVSRLFKNQQEFLTITEHTRSQIDTLGPVLHSKEQTADKKRILKASFEDETDKLHNWSLGNVVRPLTTQDRKAALDILGEVTILQKEDGTRKFVRVVKMYFALDEREHDFNTRDQEDPFFEPREKQERATKQASSNETASSQASTTSTASQPNSEEVDKTNDLSVEKASPQKDGTTTGKTQAELAREIMGGRLSDHHKKYQTPDSLLNKPKPEKNSAIEKALRKNKKNKGKNRKRNKRK